MHKEHTFSPTRAWPLPQGSVLRHGTRVAHGRAEACRQPALRGTRWPRLACPSRCSAGSLSRKKSSAQNHQGPVQHHAVHQVSVLCSSQLHARHQYL